MASIDRALASLDEDYQQRRAALLAEQQAAEGRAAELARLAVAGMAAKRAKLDQARGTLAEEWKRVEAQLADLVADVTNWRAEIEQVYENLTALASMHSIFQQRGQGLATVIGALMARNTAAFATQDEQIDWLSSRRSLLPSAADLAPSAKVIQADMVRALGIRVPRADLLQRAYWQAATTGAQRK